MRTARGRHVFAQMDSDAALCASGGKQYADLGDGEFRVGSGCYCMLPPSVHPNGVIYEWMIPPNGRFPPLKPEESGFARSYVESGEVVTQQTQQTHVYTADPGIRSQEEETSHASTRLRDLSIPIQERIRQAIKETLPDGPKIRNRQILLLARYLKAIPELADTTAVQLRKIVKAWHQGALPSIRTKEFEETWLDFRHAWANVKHSIGDGIMSQVVEAASLDNLPSVTDDYDRKECLTLVAVCRELQRRNKKGTPFFLSCRTAGDLVKVDHQTAARWLRLLVLDGILTETEKGTAKGRRASACLYIGNQ